MKHVILIIALLGLAACDLPVVTPPAPSIPPMPDSTQDTCSAATHAALIGQADTALERVLLLGQVRVIRPGMAVTADYSPTRINFIISETGEIVRIYCG